MCNLTRGSDRNVDFNDVKSSHDTLLYRGVNVTVPVDRVKVRDVDKKDCVKFDSGSFGVKGARSAVAKEVEHGWRPSLLGLRAVLVVDDDGFTVVKIPPSQSSVVTSR